MPAVWSRLAYPPGVNNQNGVVGGQNGERKPSSGGPDVLVQMKEVFGVVLRLDLSEPAIIAAVGGSGIAAVSS